MSLVNDALKRATEKHKSRPSAPAANLQLRPVEPPKPHKTGMGLVLPVTLLTIIVAALFSLRSAKEVDRTTPAPLLQPHEPAASNVATPATVLNLVPSPLAVSAKEIPVTPPAAPPAPVVVAVPPQLAPLRLQAVFYSPPHPSAIISGKTVHVGDSVRELQVVAIGSSSALLISSTQTNFLRLE